MVPHKAFGWAKLKVERPIETRAKQERWARGLGDSEAVKEWYLLAAGCSAVGNNIYEDWRGWIW